ncbi:MAG: molybdopterin-dependent oxidoreductase [Deltaproteobacteria bacterium]
MAVTETRSVDASISRRGVPFNGTELSTICVLCSHNCGVAVDVEEGCITKVRADPTSPIREGYFCNKGATIGNYIDHDQRVSVPLKRGADGKFEEISWEQAISEIAERLMDIRTKHSPRAIGLCGMGGQGNHMDAAYAGNFLKAVGTRRFFNAYAQEKTQHHLIAHWMFDASPGVFFHADIENSKFILMLGTNPRISNRGHNANDFFRDLAKDDSRILIAVDPRETETTRGADRHLQVKPGGDSHLLLGLAAAIVQNELTDMSFLAEKSVGYEEVREVLGRVDIAEMERRAGLESGALPELAEGFARAESASIFWDLGVEQQPFSTLISYLMHLNCVLTGNVGNSGGNVFVESFSPPMRSASRFEEPERALASGIPAIRALGQAGLFSPTLAPEEILLDHPERMRALIVEGSNPLLSFSDSGKWREAVAALDLLVVIDPAFTETARLADYILPTPSGYEKWEISMFPKRHPEIHTQVRPPIVPVRGEGLPEAEIYTRLLEAMGLVLPPPASLEALGDEPTEAARTGFLAAALAELGPVMEKGIDAEVQIFTWAYRTIGRHFDAPSLVAVWYLCQQNASGRKESVLRTLGEEWRARTDAEIGEELFRRILAHPEGVEVARASEHNLEENTGWEDGRIRLAIPEMLGEMRRAMEETVETTAEYPLVLGSGLRTRWTANTIQRDPNWRRGRGPHCILRLHPQDAASLGVSSGDSVRLATKVTSVELPAEIDDRLRPGYVAMPNGFGMQYDTEDGGVRIEGVNMNEFTSIEDRDPFTGCPWHRFVPCRIERV